MPLIASAVVQGVSALGKMGVGIGQIIHANKLAKSNKRPTFDIQEEYFDNRDIAARMAQRGLSDEAIQYYTDENRAGLGASASALLQAGGGINSLVNAYETYQSGAAEIAARDAELQNKNILYYMDRNDAVAKQKVQKWVLDKYEPFKDKAAAASQEKAAGIGNLFGGASEAAGTLAAYSQSDNYSDLLKSQTEAWGRGEAPGSMEGQEVYQRVHAGGGYGMVGPQPDPYDVAIRLPNQQPVVEPPPAQSSGLTAEEMEVLKTILTKLKR